MAQLVAQLVVWVKQHPAGPGADNRVLLSKSGLELYISVFQYEPGWLRYLVILLTPLPVTGATQVRCSTIPASIQLPRCFHHDGACNRYRELIVPFYRRGFNFRHRWPVGGNRRGQNSDIASQQLNQITGN